MGQQKKCTFALWFCPNSCRKLLSFLRGVDKAGTVVVIIRSLLLRVTIEATYGYIPLYLMLSVGEILGKVATGM